jgi:SWIM zinc finger
MITADARNVSTLSSDIHDGTVTRRRRLACGYRGAVDRTQVLALAPDEASVRAAEGVRSWLGTGTAGDAVWGECAGSGRAPYRTIADLTGTDRTGTDRTGADLTGPAYTCSCPSRKVPCKHVLALLIKHADGGVPPATQQPDWVSRWLAQRTARLARADGGTDGTEGTGAQQPADREAARRRSLQRSERVAAGLDELDQWLADQVRQGLAGAATAGYAHWEAIAARMVDAQCPSIAERLRGLAGAPHSGPGWESRLLEELSLLRLLATAYRARERLPTDMADTVRSRIGFTTRQVDVIAAADPVSDVWDVLGWRDTEQERIRSRRIWLRGHGTGRPALVLSFAAAGESLDASFLPGTAVPAALAFYPGALPLRAVVISRDAAVPAARPPGGPIADVLRDWAAALGRDPWQESLPVVLGDAIPVAGSAQAASTLLLDAGGDALPVHPAAGGCWPLVALSGGHPLTVAAECTPRGLWPMTAWPRGSPPVAVLLLVWPDSGTSGTSWWPLPCWERSDARAASLGRCSTAQRCSRRRAGPAGWPTTPLPRPRRAPTTARPSGRRRRRGSAGCCAEPALT